MSTTYTFLTDEWFQAVADLLEEHGKPDLSPKLQDIVLNLDVRDGDDVVQATYRGCWFEPGHDETAKATLITDREMCMNVMIEKKMALGMRAISTGKSKLKGDLKKFLPIKAARATPAQKEFEKRVLEMTVL
jgi:hypothetical protein